MLTRSSGGSLGCGTRDSGSSFQYNSSNRMRELAEMVLTSLKNGEKNAIRNFDKEKDFKHLGTLKISADFEVAPRKKEGLIVLWLEPVGAKEKDRPEHDIGIDLKYHFPFLSQKKDEPLKMPVNIVMYAVTPGKYRIKGYWKKEDKNCMDVSRDYWEKTGDYIITNSPEIEIFKAKSTNAKVSFNKVAGNAE